MIATATPSWEESLEQYCLKRELSRGGLNLAFWRRVLFSSTVLQRMENPSSAINPADGPPPHPKKVIVFNRPRNSPYSIPNLEHYLLPYYLPIKASIMHPIILHRQSRVADLEIDVIPEPFQERPNKQKHTLLSSTKYPATHNSKATPFAKALIRHSSHNVHTGTSQMRDLI